MLTREGTFQFGVHRRSSRTCRLGRASRVRRWASFTLLAALLPLPGCSADPESGRTGEAPLPGLVAQSVTATLQRAAFLLVRVETEHEGFLVTPEHPFAVPGLGWLSAGRLMPGDWVVSGKSGKVRVLSVRGEPASRPVPVFNLSVSSSSSYFVGTDDRVLVHNTKCKDSSSEALQEAIERLIREREELNLQIAGLVETTPGSPQIAELKARRIFVQSRLGNARTTLRNRRGVSLPGKDQRDRLRFEKERGIARRALEDAEKGLAELESRSPTSEVERAAFAARRKELEKQRAAQGLSYERTSRILDLLEELAELARVAPATDALEERKRAVRNALNQERKREFDVKFTRKTQGDPGLRAKRNKLQRDRTRRLYQSTSRLADSARPRGPLGSLEDELASRLREPPSEGRDVRVEHLRAQIDTSKRLLEVRRKHASVTQQRYRAQLVRQALIEKGGDTWGLDAKLEHVERELSRIRTERATLRIRERLLAQLGASPWAHAPGPVDEAQLRDFERQLAAGLGHEQQLDRIEQALDGMDPSHTDWPAAVLDEAHDVDEVLSEREQLRRQSPSAERAGGFESSYQRLLQELREERAAVEVAMSELANQHAYIQTTQAGSSAGPSWQERLRAIQDEQGALRARWRVGLEARLDDVRQELHVRRSIERFRDEAAEAELGREISLIEWELQNVVG